MPLNFFVLSNKCCFGDEDCNWGFSGGVKKSRINPWIERTWPQAFTPPACLAPTHESKVQWSNLKTNKCLSLETQMDRLQDRHKFICRIKENPHTVSLRRSGQNKGHDDHFNVFFFRYMNFLITECAMAEK